MPEKKLLAGHSFDHNGPYLKLDTVENIPHREQFYLRGKTITIKRLDQRQCVGRYDLQTFADGPCPDNAPLKTSSNICYRCFASIGFNPAFYNATPDQLSPQQRRYNEEPHSVYLANFQKGETKVGISNSRRAQTRLLEQGARSAVVVLEYPDAYEARAAEASIGNELGLTETAKKTTKRQWINQPYDEIEAKGELMELRQDIGRQMGLPVVTNDIMHLDRHYLDKNRLVLPIEDLSDSDPLTISGRIVGMIGEVLIVEQLQRLFMVSLSKIVAHLVEISTEIVPCKSAPRQISLF